MIDSRRVFRLNDVDYGSGPVIYWMSREQRVSDNWGLWFAQQTALERRATLFVVFTLADSFVGATLRHYGFMLKGLVNVSRRLSELSIPFIMLYGDPADSITRFCNVNGACCVICDFDPLRIKRQWFDAVASAATFPLIEVDGHNIVPCRVASDKREFAAYTIRPKIRRIIGQFLVDIPQITAHPFSVPQIHTPLELSSVLNRICSDNTVSEVSNIDSGEKAAGSALQCFISDRLEAYATHRNDPVQDGQSGLSPWLHFGQLSPQRVALAVSLQGDNDDTVAFLEELVVRRELADNFCFHCREYDSMDAAPEWARRTLEKHRNDNRQYIYSIKEFEGAETHDPLWNAAQRELLNTGKMHGYLRMYWAKKIMEWTETPEEAIYTAVFLNDRYSLDGRDPNGYAGIAWSICGVHDRAWGERPVLGNIRYMSYDGCRRKFDVNSYCSIHQ